MGLLLASPWAVGAGDAEESMLTGEELLVNCEVEPYADSPSAYCLQFVGGLVQTLSSLQAMSSENERIFCLEPEQTPLASVIRRVTRAVTGWLENHPQRLEEPAFLLVSEALGDNYPCNANHADHTR